MNAKILFCHIAVAHAQSSLWHTCSEVKASYRTTCNCSDSNNGDHISNLRACTQTPTPNGPATLIIKGQLSGSTQDTRDVVASAYGQSPYYDVSSRGANGLASQATQYYNKEYTTFWTRGTLKQSVTFFYMKASWWTHNTAYEDPYANASPMTDEIFYSISTDDVIAALALGDHHNCSDEPTSFTTCFNGLTANERAITTNTGHKFDAMHFVGGSWWRRNYPHTDETLFVATAADAATYTPEWIAQAMLICTAINVHYGATPLTLTIAEPDSSADYNSCI